MMLETVHKQFSGKIIRTLTSRDVGQLGSERSGTGRVSEFDLRDLLVLVELRKLGCDRSHVELA